MSFRDVLKNLMVTSVPSTLVEERTEKPIINQYGFLSSPSSLRKNNTKAEVIKAMCDCGYRRPFCACGFYKFPG